MPEPCVRAPLPYVSIDFLAFMRLLLPTGLHDSAACSGACLTRGIDEFSDLHSLHLISSLG